MNKPDLGKLIGTMPNETGLRQRARFHQGWWRAFVLNEPEGLNPADAEKRVCNTIMDDEKSGSNFLTPEAIQAIDQTKLEREAFEAGLFNEDRLFNNLLSSQPLAFNFFGPLKQNLVFAKSILELRLPGISKVSNIFFEFAPREKYSGDNSAFDVAIEIEMGSLKGLVGLECKYTDTFSAKEYSKDSYRRIFEASTSFKQPYEAYIASRFNQLFRGQLIAEALVQNKKYDFCMNGLFCHHLDTDAIETGLEFRKMMFGGDEGFRIITYSEFISDVQKLDLSWERREWSMMLWARYCGHRLSDGVFGTT